MRVTAEIEQQTTRQLLAVGKTAAKGGAARDAAYRTATGAARKEPDTGHAALNRRDICGVKIVKFNTATGGQMQRAAAEILTQICQQLGLGHSKETAGQLDSQHELAVFLLINPFNAQRPDISFHAFPAGRPTHAASQADPQE